jgi:carboxyl-terminal processing protease
MIRKTALLATGIAIGAGCATLGQQARALIGTPAEAATTADTYKFLSLFGDVFDKVRADYVEKPDEQKLVENAINGMLTSLDPHSSYLDAKGFKDMRTQTEGKFGGLGIEVTQEDGLVKVVTPIDDTPPRAPASCRATSSAPSTTRACRA